MLHRWQTGLVHAVTVLDVQRRAALTKIFRGGGVLRLALIVEVDKDEGP